MANAPSIEVFEDPAAPQGGQALIRVTGLGSDPGDAAFTIRRFGYDKGVLGPNGWQGPDVRLQPLAAGYANGTLQMTVGPDVVDEIDVGTPVEIELPAAGLRDTLNWPSVPPSVHGGGGGHKRFAFRRRTPAAAPPPTPLPTEPPPFDPSDQPTMVSAQPPPPPDWAHAEAPTAIEPRPERDAYDHGEDATALPDLAASPYGAADDFGPIAYESEPHYVDEVYENETTQPLQDDPARKFPWGIVIGTILFLLLVGMGSAYYFLHEDLGLPWPFETDDRDPDADGADPSPQPAPPRLDPAEPATPEPERLPPETPDPQPPAPEPPSGDAAAPSRDWETTPLDFARILLAQDRSPERTFELAQEYLDRGETDVALLLLEDAQGDGYPPAITAIGRLYDPVHFGPRQSPFSRANPLRAAEYYRRAAEAGDADARAALRELEAWLNAAAADGDPAAQEALDRW